MQADLAKVGADLRDAVRAGSPAARAGRGDAGGASQRDQVRVQAAKPSAPGNAMADALKRAGFGVGKGSR